MTIDPTEHIERRLIDLEARLRSTEDQLAILRLLNSYGPLVDSGSATEAAELWVSGGHYDFSSPSGGSTRVEAPADLVATYEAELHMGLVRAGAAHLTAAPHIAVDGDEAQAVGYSFVILRQATGGSSGGPRSTGGRSSVRRRVGASSSG